MTNFNFNNVKENFDALHPECELFKGVRDIGNGVMQEYISFKGSEVGCGPIIPIEMLPPSEIAVISILEQQFRNCMKMQLLPKKIEELFSSWDNVKGLVRPTLVNAERNNLEDVPYAIWNDLYMVFRVDIEINEDERGSAVVSNRLMEQLGVDVMTLREQALANASKRSVEVLDTIDVVIKELLEGGVSEAFIDVMLSSMEGADGMPKIFVLRDEEDSRHGASALLYAREELQQMAADFGVSKLLILPSSIHEVLVTSYEGLELSLEDTIGLVRSVNSSDALQPEELLSDNVYVYDAVTGAFCLVDDEALHAC